MGAWANKAGISASKRRCRERKKALGLCVRCSRPAVSGFVECELCRARSAAYYKRMREVTLKFRRINRLFERSQPEARKEAERKAAALALQMAQTAERAPILRRAAEQRRRDERRAAGLCIDCGREPVPGRAFCAKHRDQRRASVRRCRVKRSEVVTMKGAA